MTYEGVKSDGEIATESKGRNRFEPLEVGSLPIRRQQKFRLSSRRQLVHLAQSLARELHIGREQLGSEAPSAVDSEMAPLAVPSPRYLMNQDALQYIPPLPLYRITRARTNPVIANPMSHRRPGASRLTRPGRSGKGNDRAAVMSFSLFSLSASYTGQREREGEREKGRTSAHETQPLPADP